MPRSLSWSARTALDSNSSRLAAPLLVAALVLASIAALIVNQRTRADSLVIEAVHIEDDFSPGLGEDDLAEIDFRVNDPEVVDLDILDSKGKLVRNLVVAKEVKEGEVVEVAWEGLNAESAVAGAGLYTVRIKLKRRDRRITPGQEIAYEEQVD